MKTLNKVLGGIVGLTVSAGVMAAPPDFSTLTASVDYSTAITAILLVMAALAGVAIVWKGGKLILRALGFGG